MGIVETGVQRSLDSYGISLESQRNYALGFIPTGSHYVIAVPKGDKERVKAILEAMNRSPSDAKKLELAGLELEGDSLVIKGNLLAASSLIQQNLAVSLSSDKEKAITRAVAVHFGGLGAKHLNEFDRIDADSDRIIEFSDLDRDTDKRLTNADANVLRAQLSPQAYTTLVESLGKQGVEFEKQQSTTQFSNSEPSNIKDIIAKLRKSGLTFDNPSPTPPSIAASAEVPSMTGTLIQAVDQNKGR